MIAMSEIKVQLTGEYHADIGLMQARIEELESTPTGKAPCVKFCEANAFGTEIAKKGAEIDRLNTDNRDIRGRLLESASLNSRMKKEIDSCDKINDTINKVNGRLTDQNLDLRNLHILKLKYFAEKDPALYMSFVTEEMMINFT